ncbi:MAG: hypothetical protein DMD83_09720 [Candidatus Rokuibacteriota bacterium]|nr:MAG: hypothetical protein DMD83_09720 [Candidatus Rokubacteria bacterium]
MRSVETSIVGRPAARPGRGLLVAARPPLTHAGWRERRPMFDSQVLPVMVDEVGARDPRMSAWTAP